MSILTSSQNLSEQNIEQGYQDLVSSIEASKASFYVKNQFYRFINNNNLNYFDRNNMGGHITSSAFVVNSDLTHMLLVLHKKLGKWLQPGGHWEEVNTNPISLFDNSIKELQEEAYGNCAVDFEVLNKGNAYHLDIHDVGSHKHYDVGYLLKIEQNIATQVSFESLDVRWISIEEIIANKDKKEFSSARLLEVAQSIQREKPELLNQTQSQKNTLKSKAPTL